MTSKTKTTANAIIIFLCPLRPQVLRVILTFRILERADHIEKIWVRQFWVLIFNYLGCYIGLLDVDRNYDVFMTNRLVQNTFG